MPYEWTENDFELQPEASSAYSGGPPAKLTGIGVLDPPVPPKRPPGPSSASLLLRILGGVLLLGLAWAIWFLLFARR